MGARVPIELTSEQYVVDADSIFLRSSLQAMADILGTVVASYGHRLTVPFHDLFQDPNDTL